MGLTACEIHGYSGIALVCPHVKSLVNMRDTVRNVTKMRVDMGDVGAVVTYAFCADCAAEYHLPNSIEILADSTLDKYEQAVGLAQPVCGSCLDEAMR